MNLKSHTTAIIITMTSSKKARGRSRRAAKALATMESSSRSRSRSSSSSSSSFDSITSSRGGILSDGILSDSDNFSINTDLFVGSSSSGSGSGSSCFIDSSSSSMGSFGSSSDNLEEFPIFDINTHRLLNDVDIDTNDLEDLMVMSNAINVRKDRWEHQRMIWDDHVKQLMHEGMFENEYRMSYEAYETLLSILKPLLQRKEYNSRSEDPILPEHIVATGMRYLCGGRVLDVRHVAHFSRPATYKAIDDFIDAVNLAPELDISLPRSAEEWKTINDGWRKRSSIPHIYHGCVGAMDGFFQPTDRPTEKEAVNVVAYYSGHYESYGLNCQAMVQDDLQFRYFGVVSPGCTNDNVSYPRAVDLKDVIDNLPRGLYIVADAAYNLSENVLTPFTGSQRHNRSNDSFNYHLSQLRIRVEMAFGYMVNKFRILRKKLECSMEKNTAILMACARLHNFILQQDRPYEKVRTVSYLSESDDDELDLDITPLPTAPLGMTYMPQLPDDTFEMHIGVSHTRNAIVEELSEEDIGRPMSNLIRKREELRKQHTSLSGDIIDREFFSPL